MQAAKYAHLALRPGNPAQLCDVQLKLDDGTILPVHSRVLAQHSPVFRDMFGLGDDEPLSAASSASATSTVEVPLSDCSREIAAGFLAAVYTLPSMSEASLVSFSVLLPIARLGHKFNMKVGPRPFPSSSESKHVTKGPFEWSHARQRKRNTGCATTILDIM